jgi:inorganic pyrophosphatase
METPLPNRTDFVPPGPNIPQVVNCIVEIPKGRRSKFEVDKKTGLIRLDRYLYSSLHYPGDYGFIPQTLAEDGDPLDILVMVNEPTFSGCLIEARPIGLFKMTDKGFNDFKVLAVPASDPTFAEFHDLWRVPAHYLREVEHFFATYKQLEAATVQTLGWEGAEPARHEVIACVERYQQAKKHNRRKDDESPDVQIAAPLAATGSGRTRSSKPAPVKTPKKRK